MIFLIRASHANSFELQHYAPIASSLNIKVITSGHPLTDLQIEGIPLWSPTDLPNFAFRRQILNRLVGGEQWLIGLEKYLAQCSHVLEHESTKESLILHTAETYTPYTHQAVQLRKAGKIDKLICTCWETIPHNNEKFARLRNWKSEAYRYVDIFHTPTDRAKQALLVEGVDSAKIVVIPYGVDLTRFHPPSHLPGVSRKGHRPLILTVARLEKEKGMEDIEAVARALPQYDFLVVGQGSRVPVGKNITVKSVPYDNIHKIYPSADLFFLPSHTTKTWEEQYGMCLVEAMACGIPIVATDTGAIREVIGEHEILVKEGDIASMIESIDGALSYKCNVLTLSRAGRARAERLYDAKKVAQKLAGLYA